jgi:arylamine N-acetyltransferase
MENKKRVAEDVLLRCFKEVPFHNIFYLLNENGHSKKLGGTCTDKVLHYISCLEEAGISAKVCSGVLQDKHSHRLAMLEINGHCFYADVGSGWPSLQLIPSNKDSTFEAYNITFLSYSQKHCIRVERHDAGRQGWTLLIPKKEIDKKQVAHEIQTRYDKDLPFRKGVRFSQIIGEQFLFLKDNELRIYDAYKGFESRKLEPLEVVSCIKDVFHFPLSFSMQRRLTLLVQGHFYD